MNREAIGAVSEALAAVGVIVTLMYLAVQIRVSNRTSTADPHQSLAGKSQDRLLAVAANPVPAIVLDKPIEELDEVQ